MTTLLQGVRGTIRGLRNWPRARHRRLLAAAAAVGATVAITTPQAAGAAQAGTAQASITRAGSAAHATRNTRARPVPAAAAVHLTASRADATVSGVPAAPPGWSTQFSDDFHGAAGSAPDSGNWQYDTGPGSSFGTGEIETMTNSTSNGYLDGHGNLDLTALGSGSSWTSARLQTTSANVGAPAGGELEVTASIQQPNPANGLGYWPAFWMLGPGQWPENGEIDILEDGYPDGVCNCTSPDNSTTSGGTMSINYVAAYTAPGSGSGS